MADNHSTAMPPKSPPKRMPWWASVLLATISYCVLKFVLPQLHPINPILQKACQAAPAIAPLVTIPFLLLAAKQLYDVDLADKGNEQEKAGDEEKPADTEAKKQED